MAVDLVLGLLKMSDLISKIQKIAQNLRLHGHFLVSIFPVSWNETDKIVTFSGSWNHTTIDCFVKIRPYFWKYTEKFNFTRFYETGSKNDETRIKKWWNWDKY